MGTETLDVANVPAPISSGAERTKFNSSSLTAIAKLLTFIVVIFAMHLYMPDSSEFISNILFRPTWVSLILMGITVIGLLKILSGAKKRQMINCIQGPKTLPLLGNILEFTGGNEALFNSMVRNARKYKRLMRIWLGPVSYVCMYDADLVKVILSSSRHIEKSQDYLWLRPWLGTGLLVSGGQKWHSRRKMLTPAFHFKILEDALIIFCEQSEVLINKLNQLAFSEIGSPQFNIFPYVTLCTLDVICESAMGKKLNAQIESDSDYVRAVYKAAEIITARQYKPWLQPEIIFKMSKYSKELTWCLGVLHDFTNKVIQERKEQLKQQAEKQEEGGEKETSSFQGKKRLAFLDLLIHYSKDGEVLSDKDIREEVDTFMFEGHDTTAAGICFCLYLIGSTPVVQEKVMEELYQIFGDSDRKVEKKDLLEMKYLECCIKEAQRIYPSVPIFARELQEDIELDGYTIPAGTIASIFSYMLHRNPDVFPNPEEFNPDNFLPKNSEGRHPYAYIPFSAGPRNCIGQKFAMMEEKVVISTVLRHFRVESVTKREDLHERGELVLRPAGELLIKIFPRKTT